MTVEVFAPAKVNLTLHVTGRRNDGYHLIDSLVAFADIGDRLTLETADRTSLEIMGPESAMVPLGEENLVLQAVNLARPDSGVRIRLEKRIPIAAGLGGGSSDAAAVLRGLAALEPGCTPAPDAALLGADVPMCLAPGPQRAEGIGDRLSPIGIPSLPAVLVNPRVPVSTAAVFAAVSSPEGSPMGRLAEPITVDQLFDFLGNCRNDLEEPARRIAPAIGDALDAIRQAGAPLARMSGSGATCFGLYSEEAEAQAAARTLTERHPDWWVVSCRLGDMRSASQARRS